MVLTMVLLRALSGTTAGTETVARRLPFRVGRGPGNDLRVELAGVWENHLRLELTPDHRVALRAEPGAITTVNGHPVTQADLRLGDIIAAGAARFLFWLSPPRQSGLVLRETLTWVGLALLVAFQIFVAVTLVP